MSSHTTTQAILDLLCLLNSAQYGISKNKVFDEFGINERTFYRYLNTIKQAGFVVDNIDGYYKINNQESEYDLSDLLHFSEEEAYILQKAIHSIDENTPLKSKLIDKLYSLYKSNIVTKTIVKLQNSENIQNLSQAIEDNKQVKLIDYRSSNSNKVRTRLVEPIEFTTNYLGVWAYDIESGITKIYKNARIGKVEIQSKEISHKSEHLISFTDVFRFSGTATTNIILECTILAYNLMIEEYPLSEEHFTKQGDKYIFEAPICDFRGVGRFVLGLLDNINVIESNEFKEYLKEKISQNYL